MTGDDARALARGLEVSLPQVSDTVVDLMGQSFGDEHTLALLEGAAQGQVPDAREAQGAREILSGPPKSEARALIDFLRGGEFTMHPATVSGGSQR